MSWGDKPAHCPGARGKAVQVRPPTFHCLNPQRKQVYSEGEVDASTGPVCLSTQGAVALNIHVADLRGTKNRAGA